MGAAIGGGLAGLTAMGTSWFNLKTTRQQLAAQQQEAARQRRSESIRERREPRAKCYADFMAGGQQFITVLRQAQDQGPSAVHSQAKILDELRHPVVIWGPESVAAAAYAVCGAAGSLSYKIRTEHVPAPIMHGLEVAERLRDFIEAARAALEEDGNVP
ncbi:hypothetical protein PO587_02920 [Streptomyces gilvifuscus]|uniref:Uncharacterized protein n=1 Tax=Streptomyces gilvifuscus TaxID=1550617 RepID=A0ABT5FLL3_9ACTN|nr:hypothetical protein [Streptomyces gilvifuscus]MDC2953404.1 hypothetical protein [Streptomyces gilvifuscus]